MNVEQPSGQPSTQETVTYTYPARYGPPVNWQPKAPVSGLRIATGVVALVFSVVGTLHAGMLLFVRHGASTPLNGWLNSFLIVGSIGCLVTGIVIMAKQRKRGGATPWLVASFGALAVIASLGFMAGPGSGLPLSFTIILPVPLATLVLAVLVIVKDKARVKNRH